MSIDGLLVVDKPAGLTSHDVVDRARRLLGERRIGHTGTLDPGATGVLALLVGRATRLAQFMSADEKVYEARIQLGWATDTDDNEGTVVGPVFAGPWPSRTDIEAALAGLRGTHAQRPPAYSAKKVDGRRAYAIARDQTRGRAAEGPAVKPVSVTLFDAVLDVCDAGVLTLTLRCSAGYYVRALARDLGERLGTGGHLAGLRRTRSGSVTLADAHRLSDLEAAPDRAGRAIAPLSALLPDLPALRLTASGLTRAGHGAWLGPSDVSDGAALAALSLSPVLPGAAAVRLMAPDGRLVGIARIDPDRAPDALHPSVVLM